MPLAEQDASWAKIAPPCPRKDWKTCNVDLAVRNPPSSRRECEMWGAGNVVGWEERAVCHSQN